MHTAPLSHAATVPPRLDAAGGRPAAGTRFSGLLTGAQAGHAAQTAAKPQTAAHNAAQQLVATTLILPILAEVRQDPMRSPMFHGGQAEDTFGAQLDTLLADRITRRADFPIVQAVERQILRQPPRAAATRRPAGAPRGRDARAAHTPPGQRLNLHG